ncbi:hypothetical protein BJ508DRAFT_326665 [Ascobolus immersus RN42]|uniref:Uncharacterized protein n=1 Tax=Ascobolus immersus RN42 TaxID=1160509 RepID=A0A3N4I5A7_ASCIM|nr:hypothetical protein BJ508DRAFT_326665 [Ascobolus immersus RN42]
MHQKIDRATSPQQEPPKQPPELLAKLESLEGTNAEHMRTTMTEGLTATLAGLETYSAALKTYDRQFKAETEAKENDLRVRLKELQEKQEYVKNEEMAMAKRKVELELEYRKKGKELETEYEKKQKDLLANIAKLISGGSS